MIFRFIDNGGIV